MTIFDRAWNYLDYIANKYSGKICFCFMLYLIIIVLIDIIKGS